MVLTLLFIWVVDDSLEMSECGLCEMTKGGRDRKRTMENGEKKKVSSRVDSGDRY